MLLKSRYGFERHFDAQVAACHHQRIRKLDDLVYPLDRLRLLDLRHQSNAAAGDLANLGKVLRALDEGKRHPIDLSCRQHGVEVDAVLVRQRADAKQGIGQADALAIRNPRAGNDRGDDALAIGLFGAQMQLAIVDEQAMAGLHRFEDLRMRKIDAAAVAGHVAVVERECLADLELDLAFGELSDAQLRPLQIGEDADRTAAARLDHTDPLDQRAHDLMACMAHVDTEQIGPRLVQLLNHLLVGRCRPERREDFDFPVPSHQFWLSCVPGVSES